MAWSLTDVTTGVDLSAYVDAPSLSVAQRAYAEMSTLRVRIRDEASALTIANEHELLLADGAVKHFAGPVRSLVKTDTGVSGQRIFELACQDYSSFLDDDYVPAGIIRSTSESDKARITWLFSTYGTRGISIGASVVQLRATMPAAQDFSGKTLHQCLTMIAAITGGSFFVDYDKVLHYFSSEVNAAPFNLSDAPDLSTTFGYEDFQEASDTVDFVNEVHVIGAGVSTTRYLGGSPPTPGTRRGFVLEDSSILDLATAQARGDALLASYGVTKKPSTLVTYKPGLRAGMTVQVTHAGWGISAVTYRIAGMQATPGTKNRIRYQIDFGSGPVELGSMLSGQAGAIADAAAAASGAAAGVAQIADLSVGGANLVPNSSFEDGSSWTVGSNWVIGFTPGGGQLAFHGTDTARAALAAQTAGDLVTPKIPVARADEYVVSFWRFIRSRSAGTLRAYVKEYNASNVLLATTNLDFAAADTDWTRAVLRYAPAAAISPAKIAWQPTTSSIEVGFNSAGASATLTADIDGVQVERGEALTAYAPRPQEIVAGSIGTTQIADDAITTPKLVASAITAAKIAAGTITGDRIAAGTITANLLAAGAITLYDENGATLLTPAGFAGAWFDFVTLGLYNARLLQGVVGTIPDGRTTALPYWTVSTFAGTGSVLAAVAGGGVRATFTGTGTRWLTSDPVPVVGGETFELFVNYAMTYLGVAGAGGLRITPLVRWRDATGAIISTDTSSVRDAGEWATTARTVSPKSTALAPDNAVTAELILQLSESTHTAGNEFTIYGAALRRIGAAFPPEQKYDFSTMASVNLAAGANDDVAISQKLDVAMVNPAFGPASLTGIVAPRVDKRLVRLFNEGGNDLVIKHEDAGSAAANRFDTAHGLDLILRANQSVEILYDSTGSPADRWRVLDYVGSAAPAPATPAITNGGTATYTTNEVRYSIIGDIVFWSYELVINAAGSGGGLISIAVPFAHVGKATMMAGLAIGFTTFADGPITGLILANGSVITPRDKNNVVLSRAHFAAGAALRLTGSYFRA